MSKEIDYKLEFTAYHYQNGSITVSEYASKEEIEQLVLENIADRFLDIKIKERGDADD